jgi:hypothetical protein
MLEVFGLIPGKTTCVGRSKGENLWISLAQLARTLAGQTIRQFFKPSISIARITLGVFPTLISLARKAEVLEVSHFASSI